MFCFFNDLTSHGSFECLKACRDYSFVAVRIDHHSTQGVRPWCQRGHIERQGFINRSAAEIIRRGSLGAHQATVEKKLHGADPVGNPRNRPTPGLSGKIPKKTKTLPPK